MTSQVRRLLVYRIALQVAAIQVPAICREEWLREWNSELWYVHRETLSIRSLFHPVLIAFCRGAFADASCLRGLDREATAKANRTAQACIVVLCAALLAFGALTISLPGVRHAMRSPYLYQTNSLVTIWPANRTEAERPEIRLGTVRAWQRRSQHLFEEFAFYQPVGKSLHVAKNRAPELMVGRSSDNLFDLLGVPILYKQSARMGSPEPLLVLTQSTWRTRFDSRPEIFGMDFKLGLTSVRIAGVVSDEVTPAGAHVDAWLLLPPNHQDALSDSTPVFLFARTTQGEGSTDNHWSMSVNEDRRRADFVCYSVAARYREPWHLFLFSALLAFLALPATISLPLDGHMERFQSRLSPYVRSRRAVFLALKVILSLGVIYLCMIDLAYGIPWHLSFSPQYIQLVASFTASLWALRWALRDQRQRCPVCLGRLSCPARVGEPSRNFLSWNGTELICAGGHGLLHVPELPTSWFSAPLWLDLDPSWRGLFLQTI